MAGYRDKAIKILADHIERIKANAPEKVAVSLPMPEDHSEDYELAIAMLEWSRDDHLELSDSEFSQYVMDNWGWQASFSESYMMYTSST